MKRLIFLILVLATSCDGRFCDSFLTQEPEGMVGQSNFWKTEADMASISRELHALFRRRFGDVTLRSYRDRGLLFDYLGRMWKSPSDNELEKLWDLNSPAVMWDGEYNIISVANQIIGHIQEPDIPEARKNFYLGEALTIRAWTYFYILRTWGDAPLLTHAYETGMKAKSSWQEIAGFIIEDLKKATTLLPPAGELRNGEGKAIISKQIPSQGTAYAILAHVYAWKASLNKEPGLYSEGIKAADQVIKSKEYELASNPAEVCKVVLKGNSKEGIFELDFYDLDVEMNNAGSCLAFSCTRYPVVPNTTPATKRTSMRLNFASAYKIFNTCGEWFDEIFYKTDEMEKLPEKTTQGAAYIWKFRDLLLYEDGEYAGTPKSFDMNEILIRLADIILLRAEMRAKTGDTEGAIKDLNEIRERCKAPLYDPSEGDLAEAIFHQREQELFLEGINIRFFDIIRNQMFSKLRGRFKTMTLDNMKEVFIPVGAPAFRRNPLMLQNEYWQNYPQFKI